MNKMIRLLISIGWVSLLACCASERPQPVIQEYPVTGDISFISLSEPLGEVKIPEDTFWQRLKLIFVHSPDIPSLNRPTGIAFNKTGDVFVVDTDAGQVLRYHYEDGDLVSIMPFGEDILVSPRGITFVGSTVFVTDQGLGKIVKFDSNYVAYGVLEIEGLDRPGQIRFNKWDNNLLIVDTPGHQVIVTDTIGNIQVKLSYSDQGNKVLQGPVALDIAPDGKIVVLDALTRRVELFTPDYHYLSGFGKYDRVPGSFAYPRGLAISSDGFVFVCDAAFGNIQVFNQNGALLYFWGEVGRDPGEFLLPSFLIFDEQNNLYVADQYNSRVQIFHYLPVGN